MYDTYLRDFGIVHVCYERGKLVVKSVAKHQENGDEQNQ